MAEPATLTGSIGIFGGKFVTRGFEEEILGLGHDTQKRGANADIYSTLQPYTPQQEARMQHLMDGTYRTFVGHVAAGRRMSRPAVEGIASGRVWTGAAAQKIGLVDELGGLDRALEIARQQARIGAGETVGVDFYPAPPSWLDLLRREAAAAPAGGARGGRQEPRNLPSPPAPAAARKWPGSPLLSEP